MLASAVQASFDDVAPSLRELTFVVVDLETTGGSPADCAITEIGAVKLRGGEVVGELQTLVNPHVRIPPFVAVLTGITDAMVAGAPTIAAVLPAFLEFSRGAVLVAHNAPFDVGFLRAAAGRLGVDWPAVEVLDTARLARRVLTRDEAPDCRLATLARLFRAGTSPCHRALADARATADVLHGLFERLGNLGVHSLADVRAFMSAVSPEQRRKRHLADGLPTGPGVYLFRDAENRVLYVGRSRHVRNRVRQYFVASEPRARMVEMVGLAARVDAVQCAHDLEAEVRELRLIAEHRPRYNRRSKFPDRAVYLRLTAEPFPRLSAVRRPPGREVAHLGPFPGRRAAELVMDAVHEAFPVRRCSTRLSVRGRRPVCILADLGRCVAPCDGRITTDDYGAVVDEVRRALSDDPAGVVAAAERRIRSLTAGQRYEEAAAVRDRTVAFVRALARRQRLDAFAGCAEVVAARPRADGGWDLTAARHGRFVGAVVAPGAAEVTAYAAALSRAAEPVQPAEARLGTLVEETECLLRWFGSPGTRLVRLTGSWSSPAAGGAAAHRWRRVPDGRDAAPLDDRRGLRPSLRFVPVTGGVRGRRSDTPTPGGAPVPLVGYQ